MPHARQTDLADRSASSTLCLRAASSASRFPISTSASAAASAAASSAAPTASGRRAVASCAIQQPLSC